MDIREIERTGLFNGLDTEQRSQAMAAFKAYEFGPGEVLLEEGEPDRSMLVVVEGTLDISLSGVPLGRASRGELVGEMTLLGSLDRRSATVTSVSHSKVIILDEEGLRFLRLSDNPVARIIETLAVRTIAARLRDIDLRIVEHAPGEPVRLNAPRGLFGRIANALGVGGEMPRTPSPRIVDVLRRTHGFAAREEEVLQNLATRFQMVAVGTGDEVIQEGQPAEDAYVVAEGKVGVFCRVAEDRAERVATLGPGHVLGVVALADAHTRSATCRALEPCYLVRIPASAFHKLEAENSAAGRAFRRGLIDALAAQLRLANDQVVTLLGRPPIAT